MKLKFLLDQYKPSQIRHVHQNAYEISVNLVPWSDINSTGKFLSPRRLDPIFTCLTAFNCNKIYTIGKPNSFSICQAYLKLFRLNFY